MSQLLVPARLRQENILDPWAYVNKTPGSLDLLGAKMLGALLDFQTAAGVEGSHLIFGAENTHQVITSCNSSHDGESIFLVDNDANAVTLALHHIRHWTQPGTRKGDLYHESGWSENIEDHKPFRLMVLGDMGGAFDPATLYQALRALSEYLCDDGVAFFPSYGSARVGWNNYRLVCDDLTEMGDWWAGWCVVTRSRKYAADYERVLASVAKDRSNGRQDSGASHQRPDGHTTSGDLSLGDGGDLPDRDLPGRAGDSAAAPPRTDDDSRPVRGSGDHSLHLVGRVDHS